MNQDNMNNLIQAEFEYWDGEEFISLYLLNTDYEKNTAIIAVSNRGKISVSDYDLFYINCEPYIDLNPITRISLNEFLNKK